MPMTPEEFAEYRKKVIKEKPGFPMPVQVKVSSDGRLQVPMRFRELLALGAKDPNGPGPGCYAGSVIVQQFDGWTITIRGDETPEILSEMQGQMAKAKRNYKPSADEFVEKCLVKDFREMMKKDDLFQNYLQWCTAYEKRPANRNHFGRAVMKHLPWTKGSLRMDPESKKKMGFYLNLRFRQSGDLADAEIGAAEKIKDQMKRAGIPWKE